MSGLLALLDDVAAIAKVAAASVDDVVGQAAKAGSKAAGAVIDDAAVTPKYLRGFAAARELPIVWKITKGSLKNKLIYLLPVGLLLSNFAPWLITPLLMLGGGYLCYEGAEKVAHVLGMGGEEHESHVEERAKSPEATALLEEKRAQGAIKTDFILSAEIMTIALANIPQSNIWMEAATLAAVAVMITFSVYGAVALIVKADDFGLFLAKHGRLGLTRALGRGIVKVMPGLMQALVIIGTAAMLWVGGNIIVHGAEQLGLAAPYDWIHHNAVAVGHMVSEGWVGFAEWAVTAAQDGVVGLVIGLILIPVVHKGLLPVWGAVFAKA